MKTEKCKKKRFFTSLFINVLVSGWFVPEVSDEFVHVDVMIVSVDVTHVYAQISIVRGHVQVSPSVIVHALNHLVVLATEEVLFSRILEGVKVSDLNDIIWRVI